MLGWWTFAPEIEFVRVIFIRLKRCFGNLKMTSEAKFWTRLAPALPMVTTMCVWEVLYVYCCMCIPENMVDAHVTCERVMSARTFINSLSLTTHNIHQAFLLFLVNSLVSICCHQCCLRDCIADARRGVFSRAGGAPRRVSGIGAPFLRISHKSRIVGIKRERADAQQNQYMLHCVVCLRLPWLTLLVPFVHGAQLVFFYLDIFPWNLAFQWPISVSLVCVMALCWEGANVT
jgi:hypothetical protein